MTNAYKILVEKNRKEEITS